MAKSPVSDRMAMVEKRLGQTTGKGKPVKRTPEVKPKVKPTGNPLKKKIGIKVKWEF
jgi:hypothetical protein